MSQINRVSCGAPDADYPGFDNRTIQKAVDFVSVQGGGEVCLSAGEFLLQDSVHLRDNVILRGAGIDKTVLKKAKSVKCATDNFCGYGYKEIMVTDGSIFREGDGVYIKDNTTPGFFATQTTVTEVEGNILFLADPLCGDIIGNRNGQIETIFPMIKAAGCRNALVSEMTLLGNAAENGYLEGCRGGCIYMISSAGIRVDRVKITDFNGEGISYQQCCDIRITDSVITGNHGNGLHPGSGTVGMLIEGCEITGNAKCGIFYCLRIHYNVCRRNRIVGNGWEGINVGHRDDYIEIAENEICQNGREGIFFRMDNHPGMSGKYTSLHHNTIEDNAGKAQVYIPSSLTGFEMYENTVGGSSSLLFADAMQDSYIWNNTFAGTVGWAETDGQRRNTEGTYAKHAPENGERIIDIDRIPETEYRHLDLRV